MIKSTQWIKNERTYTLEDTAGNLLATLEDRTCNGNFITEEMLQKYETEYFFKILERMYSYENGIKSC